MSILSATTRRRALSGCTLAVLGLAGLWSVSANEAGAATRRFSASRYRAMHLSQNKALKSAIFNRGAAVSLNPQPLPPDPPPEMRAKLFRSMPGR